MSTRRLISDVYKTQSLVLVAALFLGNCCASNCVPSCGNISIQHPFRLIGDPQNCGEEKYELECEHNRLLLNLSSSGKFYGKYYVHAINYDNYTIRVVDVGLQKGNCSSLPLYSLSVPNYSFRNYFDTEPYSLLLPTDVGAIYGDYESVPWAMAVAIWVDCVNPVNKSPFYTDSKTSAPICIGKQSTPPNSLSTGVKRHYSYFLFGTNLAASDVADQCKITEIVMSTLRWPPAAADDDKNAANMTSFSDFHGEVEYGFELSWLSSLCKDCEARRSYCLINTGVRHTATCILDCYPESDYSSLRCRFKRFFERASYYFPYSVIPGLEIIGWILVGRTSLGILCLLAYLVYKFTRRHLSMFDTIEDFLQTSQDNLMPIRYSFFEIKKMTRGFKDKLGEGGYGTVFKGNLRSGYLAAIKILGKYKGNGQDFINEVATIGRIHHVNVVRLIGFCATRSKRALVYEFMPNGSLDKSLFSEEGNITLSCKQIFDISVGVARGIEYLHRGCDMQILHFDIKPHNILLDENFNPKISDFGLAKLCSNDNSMVSLTAARGTMGYMAPELFYKNIGRVSYKADVYSYGMLLMEMAGKRRNLNPFADRSSQIYFPSWIYDQFKDGNEIEVGEATEEESELMKKMVITALWCIQMTPSDRPSMNKVVEMLEGNVESLEMPPKPFLVPQEMAAEDQ